MFLCASGIWEERSEGSPPRSPSGSVGAPGSRRGERPHHEHRLEEESNEPFGVGVESERIDAFAPLRDVAREDRHEERRHDGTNENSSTAKHDQREAQSDFDDSRDNHHEILVERKPTRNLSLELGALRREVGDTGTDERDSENPAQWRAVQGFGGRSGWHGIDGTPRTRSQWRPRR